MAKKSTVLLVPPNDPEAVLIYQLAKEMEIPVIVSRQPHGASLDREPDIVPLVREGGWKRVAIVEMPGVKTEAKLRKLGVEVVLIDHHHYTGLDRAHDPKGKMLRSSLEQFRKLFRVTDAKLDKLGFDPELVRGTGVMDRGFVWALQEEGFDKAGVRRVLAYQKELMATVRANKGEAQREAAAQKAWAQRRDWNGYLIVESESVSEIRSAISLLVALEIGKPTPIIIIEKKRGLIYVQESDHAIVLFKRFGGFTFGLDRCWGFKNGKKRVGLKEVVRVIEEAKG